MAWTRFTHASISRTSPEALGCCDRCGFDYLRNKLSYQFDWAGPRLQNKRILVCDSCKDIPQEQLRSIRIPADPIPIPQPRPDLNMNNGTGQLIFTLPYNAVYAAVICPL